MSKAVDRQSVTARIERLNRKPGLGLGFVLGFVVRIEG